MRRLYGDVMMILIMVIMVSWGMVMMMMKKAGDTNDNDVNSSYATYELQTTTSFFGREKTQLSFFIYGICCVLIALYGNLVSWELYSGS